MNRKILSAALVAVAGLSPGLARATITENPGDLFVGFQSVNDDGSTGSYDLLVDVGPASQFLSGGSFTGINLNSDLDDAFGTGWNANTGYPIVQWGAIGDDKYGTFAGDSSNTIFLTEDPSANAPSEPGAQAAGTIGTKIVSNLGGTFRNDTAESDNSEAAKISDTSTYSWSSFDPSTTSFGLGVNIEQANGDGPTNTALTLYQDIPNGGTTANVLGSFSLSSGGELTFASVPEPSTWLSLLSGAICLGLFRRSRRAISAS